MKEHKIFILLTDTGTLFTRMIKIYTKTPYNHASISSNRYLRDAYSFGRRSAKNPFSGGFVREDIYTNRLFKQARCAIYSCSVTSSQLQKMNAFIQKMEEEKHHYRYNLLGLFAIMFNKQFDRKRHFFCSQFVATVLQECSIVEFSKSPSQITPHDLIESTKFQLEFEGKLKELYSETKIQPTLDTA